jgi:DNA-directed RNA polymerase subunit A''
MGREIRATGDHPFYTAKGIVPAGKLRVGDRVVVYPNDFPQYEETDRLILSEDEIVANAPKETYIQHTLQELRNLNLSTIRQLNNPRVPVLARIIGHIFGDGTLILKGKVARVIFRGPQEDLEDIQRDIRFLGLEPEKIRSEKHEVEIQAANGSVRRFTGEGKRFEVRNKPFAILLRTLGAPAGDKVKAEYSLPKWIRKGPTYLQREFISSYFGCELTKPALRKTARTQFKEPVFKLAKITPKLRAGRKLAEELKALLDNFGVRVTSIGTYPGNIRKDGFTSAIIQVTLSSSLTSMLNLYGRVGYSYNREADTQARQAYEYYRHKKIALQTLATSFRLVKKQVSSGLSVAEGARRANVPYNTAFDWVRRKKKAGLPSGFPDFDLYAREAFQGLEHGLGYDEVGAIEKIELPHVYDITTAAETHNFVANEFLTGNCPPYNADFDGDEMNLHVPQGEEARTEAKLLMQVQDQILSPRYGGPIIGAKTDLLTAAYLLTRKSTYLTKEEVGKLLVAAQYRGDLPAPEIKRPTELWSGKQIFSLFLPQNFSFVAKSSMVTQEDGSSVVVKEGKLVDGVIDKNTIGAERSETLFHRIVKDNGSEPGRVFLNGLIKLLDRFITLRGFSYGIDELDISDATREKISKSVSRIEEHVQELIAQYKKGTLERLPGRSVEESLELRIMDELSKARDQAGELAEQYLKTQTDNSGVIMTKTGARGSMLNIAQMVATVGQQSIRGQRISRGYRDRALSFFEKGDVGAEARGFVYDSYQQGLTPVEFFFHSMGGREGLVDTAVRTQQSGYMQRRLINALEHIRVEYDGTVRDSRGDIIQFRYGEDGVDTAKSDHGKAVNTERLVERVELTIEKGAKASKAYVEKKVSDVRKDLTPSLTEQLKASLLEGKLTRRGVDEAVKEAVKNYRKSMIEPGEAAGIVSAQSIGEPGTQMTLRTFHFAGVREQNVTLGLPRLIEIVDARKIPSTPMMVVFLDKKRRASRDKAQAVATNITHTTLGDIASSLESDITKMRIVVTLNNEAMRDREVTLKDVKAAVTPGGCKVEVERNTVHITPQEMDIPQFNRLVLRLPLMHVKGIPQVKRALVMEERTGEKSEWVIRTEGSNLELTLETEGVDSARTTSNNMHEVAEVLGIEAARNVIIKEATAVLEEQGLDVDVRHVMLVADAMTASGEVLQVGRHGVSGEKASTLAKAAFEITIPTIVDAAIKGTRDTLRGVAENVIVGQQVPMGTGLIEVYMSMPEKAKK